MRVEFAQFAVTALYVVPGIALLLAARVIEFRALDVMATLGLAYLAGVAVLMTLSILLLVLGVPLGAPAYLLLAALLTAVFATRALKARQNDPGAKTEPRPAVREWLAARSSAWWVAAVTLFVISVFALVGFVTARNMPVDGWDGWSIWGRKGLMLFHNDSLPKEFFLADSFRFMHPDYPLLIPVWESVFFRFAGAPDTQALHAQFWILTVAAIWAAGFLAHRAAPAIGASKEWAAAIWAPLLGVLIVTPTIWRQTMTMYADIPMAAFALVAVMCCALWLQSRKVGYLAIGTVLLAATANIKNEGLTTTVAILGALLLVRLFVVEESRWRSIRPVALSVGAVGLAVLPWRAWVAANEVHGLVSVSSGLSPAFLWDQKSRFQPSYDAVLEQLLQPAGWNYLPTLAAALVLACLIVGVSRRIAAFYGLAGILSLAAILWGYVVAPTELGWHLEKSVDRLVDGFVFVCAAAVIHLAIQLAAAGAKAAQLDRGESGSANAPPAHD